MDQVLQIAALACAAVGIVLLVVRFAGAPLARWAQAFRFRRSLKRLDAVADRWAMELQPPPPSRADELARRRQRRSQPEPES